MAKQKKECMGTYCDFVEMADSDLNFLKSIVIDDES